jgi:hypothetical protein
MFILLNIQIAIRFLINRLASLKVLTFQFCLSLSCTFLSSTLACRFSSSSFSNAYLKNKKYVEYFIKHNSEQLIRSWLFLRPTAFFPTMFLSLSLSLSIFRLNYCKFPRGCFVCGVELNSLELSSSWEFYNS